ncbi:Peptidase M14 carboxypeptidase A domain-containing protein [Plasmodiophora brassicae]|uniref:Succinylglutamate desuccinylase/Aspartoacylase catalytic domain-containing protein n=2 Tax=Plasmodiophora brassicae TaxID=37360 RepID=A0A3P3YBK2_PLABS|nr:unnamed protein product [Plasmodiophora brassicae]
MRPMTCRPLAILGALTLVSTVAATACHDATSPDGADNARVVGSLNLDELPGGCVHRLKLETVTNAAGDNNHIPVIVAKGTQDGPVLALIAAVHGNELNGVPLIFRVLQTLNVETLRGTVVTVPVANMEGYNRHQRGFLDGRDLNRLFPGKTGGDSSKSYARVVFEKIVSKADVAIDLHTASVGNANSLYVRVDMTNDACRSLAELQTAQIIVHSTPATGSLRAAATAKGIPTVVVEIGDPSRINSQMVGEAVDGIWNVLTAFRMIGDKAAVVRHRKGVTVCKRSFWIFSDKGGFLTVRPQVNTWVSKGEVVAELRDLYGSLVKTFIADDDAIVVGRSMDPVCAAGCRVIHLGTTRGEFLQGANDGHA